MSKIISVVGLALIVAAGTLTAVSMSKEDVIKSQKALCAKYTKDAEAALSQKDFDKALKFAKLAIKADPENKSGYKVLMKIADAKCAGNAPAVKNTPAAPSNNKKPAKPAPAEEEEMGC